MREATRELASVAHVIAGSQENADIYLAGLSDFEALGAKPNDLLTYYFWAEDSGPDGYTLLFPGLVKYDHEDGSRTQFEYGEGYYAVFFADPDGIKLEVVHLPGDEDIPFDIDPFAHKMLLEGKDEIGWILDRASSIDAWEAANPARVDTRPTTA